MSKRARVTAADGTVAILDFPDDTPDDIMDAAVKHHIATENLKAAQAAKYPTAAESGALAGSVTPRPGYILPALQDMAHRGAEFVVEQGPEMIGAGIGGFIGSGGGPAGTVAGGALGAAAVRSARNLIKTALRPAGDERTASQVALDQAKDVIGQALSGAVQEAGPVAARYATAGIDAVAARGGVAASGIGSPTVAAGRAIGPILKNRLTAEQQSGVDLMKREGIPTSLAVDTGSTAARGAKAIIQNIPGGAGVVEAGDQATTSGLRGLSGRLTERVAPAAERTALGADIRSRVSSVLTGAADTERSARDAAIAEARSAMGSSKGAMQLMEDIGAAKEAGAEAEKEAADAAYTAFRKVAHDPVNARGVQVGTKQVTTRAGIAGTEITKTVPVMETVDSPVDLRPAKAAMAGIFERLQKAATIVKRDASPGYQALADFMAQPDFISADDAIAHVSALGKVAFNGAFKDFPAMADVSAGITKKTWALVKSALDKTADDIGAKDALDEGRRLVTEKMGTYGTKAAQAVARSAETRPIETLIRDNNITGVKSLLTQTNSAELPAMRRRVIDGFISDATAADGRVDAVRLATKWNSIGGELKQMVFKPDQIQKMNAATAPTMIFGPAHPVTQLAHLAEMNDAGAVTDALLSSTHKGVDTLSKLNLVAPDQVRSLGRLTVEDITEKMFATGELDKVDSAFNRWNAIGRAKKNLLVGAENVADLDAFFQAVKLVKKDANYSGSGKVAALAGYAGKSLYGAGTAIGATAGAVTGGFRGAEVGAALGAAGSFVMDIAGVPFTANQLAKLLYAQKGARLLTRALYVPSASPTAEALVERILGKAVAVGAIEQK